jgi:hypothetical protein
VNGRYRVATVTALLVALVAAAVFAPLAGATRAHANGVPTMVNLTYIKLSNWGPQTATGDAELIFSEGIVRIKAKGMTPLAEQRYQGWLVNSESGDAISFGRFNTDALGNVAYEGRLPPIASFGFDLLILTVEPEPDDAPQPSQQRSIGGYFLLVGQRTADGSNGAQTINAPRQLPNTGDSTLVTDIERVGVLAAVMGLSIFVGMRLGKRTA